MIDFMLYFHPTKEQLKKFGFKRYFYFGKEGDGIVLTNKNPFKVRSFFIKNYKKYLFFGISHENKEVLMKVVREGLVDFVLNPPCDYVILKYCKQNKVWVVFSLNNFSISKFKYLYNTVRIAERLGLKMIFTSGARNLEEMIPRRVIIALIREILGRSHDVKKYINDNILELYRICYIRKKCVLPGVYVEEMSEN